MARPPWPRVPAAFPPIPHYSLHSPATAADVANVVAAGRYAVAFVREADQSTLPPDSMTLTGSLPPDREYEAWIEQLLGRQRAADHLTLPSLTTIAVRWRDGFALRGRVAGARAGIVQNFRAVADRLARRGALTAEERCAAKPNLRIQVVDLRRSDISTPLPDLAAGRSLQ